MAGRHSLYSSQSRTKLRSRQENKVPDIRESVSVTETKGDASYESSEKNFVRYRYIYLMLLPVVVYYAVFCYGPMSGIVIAFQNFKPALGVSGSKWVGWKHFVDF